MSVAAERGKINVGGTRNQWIGVVVPTILLRAIHLGLELTAPGAVAFCVCHFDLQDCSDAP